nr:CMF_HP1_G0046240.mRNA.1.CDS.1 [Saccharomyces cerevisiae]
MLYMKQDKQFTASNTKAADARGPTQEVPPQRPRQQSRCKPWWNSTADDEPNTGRIAEYHNGQGRE